ncbi:nectin-1 isoform X3 [Ornithorhynchus anatinus]|uniref:nectin-1 isoform X3 n=1 Tax=Ornithorhynchus anatinus TaxID=9258 RepID=UPI0019D43BC5|nr:nectin-1 isoform X3 [Ornithorhynchus anatinus]
MARTALPGPSGCSWWWWLALSLAAALLPGLPAQLVQVNDTVSGFVGSDVVLHCNFANPLPNVKITQVTWQKATNGTKQNVAIYNPAMGVSVLSPYKERVVFLRPSFTDGTIRLSRLELRDEGVYICEFATFPTGNRESQLNLTILAKPTNHMEGTRKALVAKASTTDKILVATCTSANGKPPSTVSWDTRLRGEAEFQEVRHSNGTVTVVSRYRLVPSREAHQQPLTCVVNYQLDRFTDSLTLNVQYEPEVTIEGFDGNWYLKRMDVKLICKSDANPQATKYQWRLLNGSLPENAEVQNSTLFFKGPVTYSLAGTYVCEATNIIGTRSGQVEVNVTDKPQAQGAPSGMLGILGGTVMASLILGAAVAIFLCFRRQQRQQKSRKEVDRALSDLHPGQNPTPPLARKQDGECQLATEEIQIVHLESLQPEEKEKLQPPYYDMAASDYVSKQDFEKSPSAIVDPGHYLSYRYSFEDQYLDGIPKTYQPLGFAHPPTSFPGSRAPYIYPNEQYV